MPTNQTEGRFSEKETKSIIKGSQGSTDHFHERQGSTERHKGGDS